MRYAKRKLVKEPTAWWGAVIAMSLALSVYIIFYSH